MVNDKGIMVVGDINVDTVLILDEYPLEGDEAVARTFTSRLGGSACNTATVLASLGARASLVSNAGTDPYGQYALQEIRRSGVDTSFIQQENSYSTGFLMAAVSREGQRTMFGFRGSNRLPVPVKSASQAIPQMAGLHVSGYSALDERQWQSVLELMERFQEAGKWISLDPSIEAAGRAGKHLEMAIPLVTVWLISERELNLFTSQQNLDKAIDSLLMLGANTIVVKQGIKGSLYMGPMGRFIVPSFRVQDARDTTAAGDCFDAGYLWGWMHGLHPTVNLGLGNAVAGMAVSIGGGAPGVVERGKNGIAEWVQVWAGDMETSLVKSVLAVLRA